MKKTCTLLLLSLCGASGLYAQAPSANTILALFRKHAAALGSAYAPQPVNKGTASGERLSAEADFGDNGTGNIVMTDSARLKYSNGRYSKFDYNQFQYINLAGLDYGTIPDFLYVEPKPNNYDSTSLPLVAFDSLYHYAIDSNTGNPYLRHREGSTLFNTDTAFAQVYNDQLSPIGALQSSLGERVEYDAAGRITKVVATGPGGSTSTVAVRIITYNSAGNVTADSLKQDAGAGLQLSTLTYYTYDAAGHCLTKASLANSGAGSIDTVTRTTNTYYANGQLYTALYEDIYNTGTLAPNYSDTLAYTPGVIGFSTLTESYYDPTGTVVFGFTMRTLHVTAGKKDSVMFSVNFGGSSQDVSSLSLHLDASGNPVIGTQYDLQGGAPGVVSAYRRWYYEPINGTSGTGVKPVSAASISIAPNPTNGIITLRYAEAKTGTPISVRVTDMSGRIVLAQSLVVTGATQQIVLGSEAARGQYLISVQDAGGNVLCSQKIVKE